jgi:hypothetical protein
MQTKMAAQTAQIVLRGQNFSKLQPLGPSSTTNSMIAKIVDCQRSTPIQEIPSATFAFRQHQKVQRHVTDVFPESTK